MIPFKDEFIDEIEFLEDIMDFVIKWDFSFKSTIEDLSKSLSFHVSP